MTSGTGFDAERLAGLARQACMAGALGKFAIGRGLAERELPRRVVDGEPEIVDAGEIDRHAGEVDLFALGIGLDVADQCRDPRRGIDFC